MELPEFTKAQLQQSIETYRVQLSLAIQILTVFVLADATTVGYAIQQKFAGAIWVGLIFPIAMEMVARVVTRMTIPILATAISIEARYKDAQICPLMTTFVSLSVSLDFLESVRAAVMLSSERERIKALQRLTPYAFAHTRPVRRALRVIIVGQALLPFVLWYFAKWSLIRVRP